RMRGKPRFGLRRDSRAWANLAPGLEWGGGRGVGAPAGTPAEVIERLNREINAGLADKGMQAKLADLGLTPIIGSPSDFGKLIAAETEKWAKVVKFAGIKPE